MKRLIIIFLLATLVASCVPADKQCTVTEDCVKATCCHATGAVNNGPDCAGVMCTTECVEGTLDCNQAEIQCVKGACTVVQNA